MKTKIILTFIFYLMFSNLAIAADETIEMLNKQGKESMVFSKKIVRINVGDTVFWKAKDRGHNVEIIKKGVPNGVVKFK